MADASRASGLVGDTTGEVSTNLESQPAATNEDIKQLSAAFKSSRSPEHLETVLHVPTSREVQDSAAQAVKEDLARGAEAPAGPASHEPQGTPSAASGKPTASTSGVAKPRTWGGAIANVVHAFSSAANQAAEEYDERMSHPPSPPHRTASGSTNMTRRGSARAGMPGVITPMTKQNDLPDLVTHGGAGDMSSPATVSVDEIEASAAAKAHDRTDLRHATRVAATEITDTAVKAGEKVAAATGLAMKGAAGLGSKISSVTRGVASSAQEQVGKVLPGVGTGEDVTGYADMDTSAGLIDSSSSSGSPFKTGQQPVGTAKQMLHKSVEATKPVLHQAAGAAQKLATPVMDTAKKVAASTTEGAGKLAQPVVYVAQEFASGAAQARDEGVVVAKDATAMAKAGATATREAAVAAAGKAQESAKLVAGTVSHAAQEGQGKILGVASDVRSGASQATSEGKAMLDSAHKTTQPYVDKAVAATKGATSFVVDKSKELGREAAVDADIIKGTVSKIAHDPGKVMTAVKDTAGTAYGRTREAVTGLAGDTRRILSEKVTSSHGATGGLVSAAAPAAEGVRDEIAASVADVGSKSMHAAHDLGSKVQGAAQDVQSKASGVVEDISQRASSAADVAKSASGDAAAGIATAPPPSKDDTSASGVGHEGESTGPGILSEEIHTTHASESDHGVLHTVGEFGSGVKSVIKSITDSVAEATSDLAEEVMHVTEKYFHIGHLDEPGVHTHSTQHGEHNQAGMLQTAAAAVSKAGHTIADTASDLSYRTGVAAKKGAVFVTPVVGEAYTSVAHAVDNLLHSPKRSHQHSLEHTNAVDESHGSAHGSVAGNVDQTSELDLHPAPRSQSRLSGAVQGMSEAVDSVVTNAGAALASHVLHTAAVPKEVSQQAPSTSASTTSTGAAAKDAAGPTPKASSDAGGAAVGTLPVEDVVECPPPTTVTSTPSGGVLQHDTAHDLHLEPEAVDKQRQEEVGSASAQSTGLSPAGEAQQAPARKKVHHAEQGRTGSPTHGVKHGHKKGGSTRSRSRSKESVDSGAGSSTSVGQGGEGCKQGEEGDHGDDLKGLFAALQQQVTKS